jgi:hypothetical protein
MKPESEFARGEHFVVLGAGVAMFLMIPNHHPIVSVSLLAFYLWRVFLWVAGINCDVESRARPENDLPANGD